MNKIYIFLTLFIIANSALIGQNSAITGSISSNEGILSFARVSLIGKKTGVLADSLGTYRLNNLSPGQYKIRVSYLGFLPFEKKLELSKDQTLVLDIKLDPDLEREAEEVVITGTLKEVKKMESPVAVEVYSSTFFKKNPNSNIFEALQNVNGVRPQLNCNVCNTGDIHINGLEGPYTMVLLDGMPIVSGLSTVYGLSGIPNSLIERVEIVKGPASSLYGSEAVGGLINIITKKPSNAAVFSADVFGSTWGELNADLGFKFSPWKKADVLTGINLFNYGNPIDNNGDNFTDVTLQKRVSVFQKWNFKRKNNKLFTLGGRYFYEDRWGGEMQWTPEFRGGDSIYGESIYTERWEVLGNYQLPTREKLLLSFSFNSHDQNSVYGDLEYLGLQRISFGQLTWDKKLSGHDLLFGLALRHTFYDDNTTATAIEAPGDVQNQPDVIWLPGLFVQDEISLADRHKLLLGARYDHHSRHGSVFTPRLAYRWKRNDQQIFRVNAGTGFRAVTLFTEDHAALTGARDVLITEALSPEQSYNVNVNFLQKVFTPSGHLFSFDVTAFYTYFTNQILPNYDTDPNLIIYDNLDGYSVASGISANVDIALASGLKVIAGATLMNNYVVEGEERFIPVLNERFNGTWTVSYTLPNTSVTFDYTGNLYGPMRLPLLGELDPRDEFSPWWSLQNVQVTWTSKDKKWDIYGGVKNLLNFTPPANSIARSFDPFDRNVAFGPEGEVFPTVGNPFGLTFDPSYVYAPNQGIRGFLGVRYRLR
ncbi:MAG: TonB-dependent receptor [Bacteroidia bacterium]|nr:TonB-dependent receptor [Bacteroidia bacterium]